MRALIQRVKSANVTIDGRMHGEITSPGLLFFLGITHSDGDKELEYVADKCVNLRIFEDENGKMNRSLIDIGGGVLIISQFTLYGDCSQGRRPSFTAAGAPEMARELYLKFIENIRNRGIFAAEGVFGADMQVSLLNDGPVTLLVESK